MQHFAKSGNFIQPVEEVLPGFSYVQQRDSATGAVRQVAVPDTYQRIPLQHLLVKILEIPDIQQAMIEWQQREGDVLQEVFDGKFFKTHPLFMKEGLIPLLLYNDD